MWVVEACSVHVARDVLASTISAPFPSALAHAHACVVTGLSRKRQAASISVAQVADHSPGKSGRAAQAGRRDDTNKFVCVCVYARRVRVHVSIRSEGPARLREPMRYAYALMCALASFAHGFVSKFPLPLSVCVYMRACRALPVSALACGAIVWPRVMRVCSTPLSGSRLVAHLCFGSLGSPIALSAGWSPPFSLVARAAISLEWSGPQLPRLKVPADCPALLAASMLGAGGTFVPAVV